MCDRLLNKGDEIQSKRTGEILECYNVMPVKVGDKIVRHEYSFFNKKKKFRTIKEIDLKQKLREAWIKI